MKPVAVTASPLDLDSLIRLVSRGGGHGAIATFIGVVRDHNVNRKVTHLEYEAYEPMRSRRSSRFAGKPTGNGREFASRCIIAPAGWRLAKRAS